MQQRRRRIQNDDELAQAIGVAVNDRTAQQVGKVHTRSSIAEVEAKRVPWLRREGWRRKKSNSS